MAKTSMVADLSWMVGMKLIVVKLMVVRSEIIRV